MRIAIITPRVSDGARSLATELTELGHTVTVRRLNKRWPTTWRADHVINWGSGNNDALVTANVACTRMKNVTSAVNLVSNKLSFFNSISSERSISLPDYTSNVHTAGNWLHGDTEKVYCRQQLRGHSGQGIVVARSVNQLVSAPLYTKGINIHHEFRVHVVGGVIIDVVRKAFRSDVPEEDRSTDIMNHAAGTVFVRSGRALERFSANTGALEACITACSVTNLDFGAVDVVVDHDGQYHILEINTACGLEGTTLSRYKRAMNQLISGQAITPWDINEFQQQENTTMLNLRTLVPNAIVTFNQTDGAVVSTLTRGTAYLVERIGQGNVYVRNDRGRIQGYSPRHFTVMTTSLPSASTPPTPPPAPQFPPLNEGVAGSDRAPEDPARGCTLPDGSLVSVGGSVMFDYPDSQFFRQGQRYAVVEIRYGSSTNRTFVGFERDGTIHRYQANHCSDGQLGGGFIGSATPTAPAQDEARDVRNRQLAVNDTAQVTVAAGGHGIPSGTIVIVRNILSGNRIEVSTTANGTLTVILAARVIKMTQQQVDQLNRLRALNNNTEVVTINVGGTSIRVRGNALDEVRRALRSFAV